MSNELIITIDKKEQHDIRAGVTCLDQESGCKKKICFKILRKVARSTQHKWHKLLRKTNLANQEETENDGGKGFNSAARILRLRSPTMEMQEVPNVAILME